MRRSWRNDVFIWYAGALSPCMSANLYKRSGLLAPRSHGVRFSALSPNCAFLSEVARASVQADPCDVDAMSSEVDDCRKIESPSPRLYVKMFTKGGLRSKTVAVARMSEVVT